MRTSGFAAQSRTGCKGKEAVADRMDQEKPMNPVKGFTMLNFIQWVACNRPQIKSFRSLTEQELLSLVDEFEGGKLDRNLALRNKWISGFRQLRTGTSNWEGYDVARQELHRRERT
jgi:hypothetical protein